MADKQGGPSATLKRKRPSKEENFATPRSPVQAARDRETMADQGSLGSFAEL
jgi:hypothetical protein